MTRNPKTRKQKQDQKSEPARNKRSSRRRDASSSGETESSKETETESTCPECSGTVSQNTTRGERVCDDCGLVVDDTHVDRGPEWRAFNSQERDSKSRVGAPTTNMMHDNGLSTNISWQDRDANGRSISASQKRKMKRLRKWNERFKTTDSKDRNLKQALGEINRMSSALGLTKRTGQPTRKIASMIYRKCLENDLLPGRSIEGMATAALYAACRLDDVPRSLAEMAQVSRVDQDRIASAYSYTNKELSLGIGPSDPEAYLNRFINDLDVSDSRREAHIERLSRHLIKKAKQNNLITGKTPPGIAIGCMYTATKLTGETVTQAELSDIAEVTEVTIRQRYQEIIEHGEESWIHGSV